MSSQTVNNKYLLKISIGALDDHIEEKINYLINSLLALSFSKIWLKLPYFKPKEKLLNDELAETLKGYFEENAALSIYLEGSNDKIKFLEEEFSTSLPEAVVVVDKENRLL